MSRSKYSNQCIADQIAGSCNLSGITVSEKDKQLMIDILEGKQDPLKLREKLVNSLKRNK